MFLYDLPRCNVCSDGRLYADDTNLTYAADDPEHLFTVMRQDLIELKRWLKTNKLSLNTSKSKCMVIATRHKRLAIPDDPNITILKYLEKRLSSALD